MGSLIKYVARWLVWQVGEHAVTTEQPHQARITFYTATERLSA